MRAKILLTITILFSVINAAKAQINRGNLFLGGDIGYVNDKSNSNDTSAFTDKNQYTSAQIQAGKVLKNNRVVGIILSYQGGTSRTNAATDSMYNKLNQYSAGIFYREYKMLLRNFYFFGEIRGLYSHGDAHQHSAANIFYDYKAKYDGGIISFVPGLSYAVGKRLYIELLMTNFVSISYFHSNFTSQEGTPLMKYNGQENSFSGSVNLNSNLLSNFGIGFKFIFG